MFKTRQENMDYANSALVRTLSVTQRYLFHHGFDVHILCGSGPAVTLKT